MQSIVYFDLKNTKYLRIFQKDLKRFSNDSIDSHKIQFKRIKFVIKYYSYLISTLSSIMYFYYLFEFNFMLIFAIIWAIITAIYLYNLMYTYCWRFILFVLYCYRSKLLLIYANKILNELFYESKPFKNTEALNFLKQLDGYYFWINNWNHIWCKFIAYNLLYYTSIIGLFVLQVYLSRDIFMRIFMYLFIIGTVITITTFMHIPSSVNTRSKITHKLLVSLFAQKCNTRSNILLSFSTKYKVILNY